MNKEEREILKNLVTHQSGLLSPSDFINGVASRNRRAVENLIAMGYVEEVPQDVNGGHPRGAYSVTFYRASEKGLNEFAPWYKKSWYSFKNNLTLYVAIASILFGGVSSVASFYTIQGAIDAKKMSGLNFSPYITFDADLETQKIGERVIPPHFTVKNMGEVSAVQLRVQFTVFEYNTKTNKIDFRMRSDEEGQSFTLGTLEPLQKNTFEINGELIKLYLDKSVTPSKQDVIIEASILYRRDSDKKLFLDEVYYFTNPKGVWVADNDNSVNTLQYQQMKAALETYKLGK